MDLTICIVHYKGYFGQDLPTEKSLSIFEIKERLTSIGYNVIDKCITEIANEKVIENNIYVVGSHQNPTVKDFINDVLLIRLKNRQCIPSIESILAHENKGIQALFNIEHNINLVEEEYHLIDEDDVVFSGKVNKVTKGSGSSGVFIPKEGNKYGKELNRILWKKFDVQDAIDFLKIKLLPFIFKRNHLNIKYYKKYHPIVTQNKIEGIGYDYKVLIFFDRCFVLKRYTRKNDFRSSGSGNFEFCECDNDLLDVAYNFRKKISVPYVSLDIMPDSEGNYNIIEYQVVHFGPYTKKKAKFFYEKDANYNWNKIDNNSLSIEYELADALDKYIKLEKC